MSSNDAAYMQRLLAKVMALAESKRSRTFVIPSDDSGPETSLGETGDKGGVGAPLPKSRSETRHTHLKDGAPARRRTASDVSTTR